jgi:hypothetical protein
VYEKKAHRAFSKFKARDFTQVFIKIKLCLKKAQMSRKSRLEDVRQRT